MSAKLAGILSEIPLLLILILILLKKTLLTEDEGRRVEKGEMEDG